MEAFDAAVEAGVSRELADALITLVRGSEGARIALAWAPAAGVPARCATRPEAVEFSPGDLPVLREAAARYTRDEPAIPVRLAGAVVRMRRSAAGGGGTVRLRVLSGRRCRTYGPPWTRSPTGSPGTPTWWDCRSGSAGASSGGAGSAG